MQNNFSKYKLLKIPFVSKKKLKEILNLKKGKSKYSYSGNAYYLVDTCNYYVVWEKAILNDFEYRPTDPDMLKSDYYKKKFISKNLDRVVLLGESNESYQVRKAESEKVIKKINDFIFKNTNTVLSAIEVVTGSNATGADSKIKKSPILIDPRVESNYQRFTNAIKRIRSHNKILSNILLDKLNSSDDIEKLFPNQISIEELMINNSMFRKWMEIYNSDIENKGHDQSDIAAYIKEITFSEINNAIDLQMALFENKMIEEEKLIAKLRREFRVALLKEAVENGYEEYSGEDKISIYDAEAAHILEVTDIKNDNLDLRWIADINNGLLLESTLHKIWDKKKFKLNEDGEFEGREDKYKNWNRKVQQEILNNKRVKFIKKRNEYHFNQNHN